jgi:predicted nucleic acid-binding protein
MRFFDASALVKRYVRENGSAKVSRLLRSDGVAISRLSEVEVVSALARRAREGTLSALERDRAVSAFERDLPRFVIVELTAAVVGRARGLLQRHALRSADALQMASGLHLLIHLGEEVPLVAFDARLLAAWKAEGHRVA